MHDFHTKHHTASLQHALLTSRRLRCLSLHPPDVVPPTYTQQTIEMTSHAHQTYEIQAGTTERYVGVE